MRNDNSIATGEKMTSDLHQNGSKNKSQEKKRRYQEKSE